MLKSLTPLTPRSKFHSELRSKERSSEVLKVPEGPDIRTLQKRSSLSPILSNKDKVRESLSLKFKSEYNSFMNKIESFNTLERSSESFENEVPKIFDSGSSVPKIFDSGMEVPKTLSMTEKFESSFSPFESSKYSRSLSIQKKDVVVYDLFSGNSIPDSIPYLKFRKNPDNIVFVVLEPHDHEFFGYSKKELWNEVQELKERSSQTTKFEKILPIFFNLQIVEEEDYHIPMSQIKDILESPHPIYSIEKQKGSFHLYDLVPVEFGN